MRTIRFWCLVALGAIVFGGVALAADQCYTCHTAATAQIATAFQHDVHRQHGITCAGCHGGNANSDDMTKAMDTTAGFAGVPKGDAISKACAACHSSEERMKSYGSNVTLHQWETLQASSHGKLVDRSGNHVVQCITCHDAHGIVHVKDPRSPVYPLNVVKTCTKCHADPGFMRTYNPSLPVDQLEKYRASVHGTKNASGDAKAAECVSCHGSHDILPASDVNSHVYAVNIPQTCSNCHSDQAYMKQYNIPTDQYAKFAQSVHGVALLQKKDVGAPSCNKCHGNHGAVPPGVESISNVCGTCHALNADLFAASPHKKAFDEQKLPECETCHGNHEVVAASDSMLGVATGATCANCHAEGDKGYQAAAAMRALADSLHTAEATAQSLVDEAEQKGMEIGEAKFGLRDVRQARLEARTTVHAFDPARYQTVAEKGITKAGAIRVEANDAIQEFYFRRIGLGVATLIITLVAVMLFLLIKRIERKKEQKSEYSLIK